jgi:hypothetical protein
MGETGARYQVFRILGAAVTLMSVYAVSFRKGLVLVALILAGPALVGHAIVFRPRIVPASVFTIVFSFAFDVFIIVVISAAFLHAKSPPRKRFSATLSSRPNRTTASQAPNTACADGCGCR